VQSERFDFLLDLDGNIILASEARPARLHDARHMHLSVLVANGVDIRTVADRAGHSDTVLTMRLYAHALEAQRKRAAIPLDILLGE
jgi:integrase